MHGANRLASNSLLEGLVFGKRAAINILNNAVSIKNKCFPTNNKILYKNSDGEYMRLIRDVMWDKVGIKRNRNELDHALCKVNTILHKNTGRMLKLRALVAKSIIKQALQRKSSLGAHYLSSKK